MIQINLLPPEARASAVRLSIALPKRGLIFAVMALWGLISVWLPLANRLQARALVRLRAQWEQFEPQQSRLEEVQSALQALQGQAQILEALKAPAVQWAPRLNLLSDALVSQLWFTTLKFKAGSVLRLEGSAFVSGQGEGAPLSRFLQRLKEHPEFDRWFQRLELESVEQRQIKGEEIVDFTILLTPTV